MADKERHGRLFISRCSNRAVGSEHTGHYRTSRSNDNVSHIGKWVSQRTRHLSLVLPLVMDSEVRC